MIALIAQVEGPLRLIGDAESAPEARSWAALALAALLVMLASSGVALVLFRRGRVLASPSEFAFRAMARRLGARRRDRRTIARLAERIDAEPVALLISPGALERAAAASPDEQSQQHPTDAAIDRVLRRLGHERAVGAE